MIQSREKMTGSKPSTVKLNNSETQPKIYLPFIIFPYEINLVILHLTYKIFLIKYYNEKGSFFVKGKIGTSYE